MIIKFNKIIKLTNLYFIYLYYYNLYDLIAKYISIIPVVLLSF